MTGLTSKEAEKRLEIYGENAIKESGKIPLWRKFLSQFTDIMVLTLIGAAAIALVMAIIENDRTGLIDVYMILGIVILNAIIGFIQEYKSEKAIEALKKMVSPHARVIRDGEVRDIEAKYIVPGDIIVIEAGDKVPADAKLTEENELKVDESVLTGESYPVRKEIEEERDQKNKIFMGTSITNGTARAEVTATGMNTEFGRITKLTVVTEQDKTPLQKELARVGIFIGKIAAIISAILFVVGYAFQGQSFINAILFAVAVAVAAVPEGLPAIVTITLALSVQKLAKKRAIIKKLSSVETLGSTTIICSDKTGTLTQNEMTVREILLGDSEKISVDGVGYSPKDGNIRFPKSFDKRTAALLLQACALCNNAKLSELKKRWNIIGDPTEGALQTLAAKGRKYLSLKLERFQRIKEHPFDSDRKRMSVQLRSGSKNFIMAKGAPDSIMEKCTRIMINGKGEKLTESRRKKILREYDRMARGALRILAMGYKEVGKKQLSENEAENNLIFLGLVGMIDPPRKEVPKAVRLCGDAGIRIIIITGDYGPTALAIGRKIGVVNNHTRLITGDELSGMSDKKLLKIFKESKDYVFARIKPEHKLRIVQTLKKLNEVVAVTGDGVNDAPALKRADIGVAMGITGTEVSKEAANMILTDDSFASIVTAISQGRSIYQNLKKFIWFILSSNIGEVLTIFFAIILFLPSPFTAILILAVNIGTDILPALALGVEKPEKYYMHMPPRDPKRNILDKSFVLRMTYIGTLVALIVIGSYVWMLAKEGWQWGEFPKADSLPHAKAMTGAFVALVLTQLFNSLNARSEKTPLFRIPGNPFLYGAIIISIGMVLAIVELPTLQNLFRTTGLTIAEWVAISLFSSTVLIAEEMRKIFFPSLFTEKD